MFDPSSPDKDKLPPDLTVREFTSTKTADPNVELLLPFSLAETEKSIIRHEVLHPASKRVRLILLLNPDEESTSHLPFGRNLPLWLHELVGWGVFLTLIGSFLGIQIYLNRYLSSPVSQILIFITVLAEIGLLWRWDQYWY